LDAIHLIAEGLEELDIIGADFSANTTCSAPNANWEPGSALFESLTFVRYI